MKYSDIPTDDLIAKGYIFIGFEPPKHYDAFGWTLCLIHKDWKEFKLRKQFNQGWEDLPESMHTDVGMTSECPTLAMFEQKFGLTHPFIVCYDGRKSDSPEIEN